MTAAPRPGAPPRPRARPAELAGSRRRESAGAACVRVPAGRRARARPGSLPARPTPPSPPGARPALPGPPCESDRRLPPLRRRPGRRGAPAPPSAAEPGRSRAPSGRRSRRAPPRRQDGGLPAVAVRAVRVLPGLRADERRGRAAAQVQEIDKCLSRKTYVKRLVKILLLGAGERQVHFLKQMRIIHRQDFDQRAREEFRPTIYSNVIKGGGPGSGGRGGRGARAAAPGTALLSGPPAGRAGRGRGRAPRHPASGLGRRRRRHPGVQAGLSPGEPAHPRPGAARPASRPRVAGGRVTWGRGYSQLPGRGARNLVPETLVKGEG